MISVLLTTTTEGVPFVGHGITLNYPTVDFDIATEISIEEMRRSDSIQAALDNGSITLKDGVGRVITNIESYLTPLVSGEFNSEYGEKDAMVGASSPEPYQVFQKTFTPEASSASYKISWYAEVTTDNTSRPFRFGVILDGAEELCNFVDAPVVKNEFIPVSGFAVRTLNNTEHTIDFNISYVTRTSVSVRRIRVSIERE